MPWMGGLSVVHIHNEQAINSRSDCLQSNRYHLPRQATYNRALALVHRLSRPHGVSGPSDRSSPGVLGTSAVRVAVRCWAVCSPAINPPHFGDSSSAAVGIDHDFDCGNVGAPINVRHTFEGLHWLCSHIVDDGMILPFVGWSRSKVYSTFCSDGINAYNQS